MSRFIKCFGTESILGIFGDREFIGSDWFKWLDEQNIPYLMRIRKKKMMALLMIAFVWARKAGEWKGSRVCALKRKSHGRLEKSLFRYGLDYLTETLLKGGCVKGGCVGEEALHLLSLLLALPPPLGEDYRNLALIHDQSS